MEKKEGEHPIGDVGQLIVFVAFLLVWIGDSFLLHLSTPFSHYMPLSIRLTVVGLTLIVSFYLSKSGHDAIPHDAQSHRIITSGAFRYVRHPLYLASVLMYFGLVISTLSLISMILLVGIFLFYDHIASYEETWLEERFGEEYREYKEITGKWIPRIK